MIMMIMLMMMIMIEGGVRVEVNLAMKEHQKADDHDDIYNDTSDMVDTN